jgi:2-hydroxychromene-2-carboxylate isomerase
LLLTVPLFDFFYDLSSPYSYLASTQLPGLEARTGSPARLVPITLGGLRKSTGHQMPPPAQLKYMSEDTARWARRYGVRMQIPSAFPTSTVRALRACIAAEAQGQHAKAMHALFAAYWADGNDIADPAVVSRALAEAGLPAEALIAATETQELKDALRRNTEQAFASGVFGVPMFRVGERLFWGNDRLEFIEQELQRGE